MVDEIVSRMQLTSADLMFEATQDNHRLALSVTSRVVK